MELCITEFRHSTIDALKSIRSSIHDPIISMAFLFSIRKAFNYDTSDIEDTNLDYVIMNDTVIIENVPGLKRRCASVLAE
jgi:hypothetical protein